MTNAIIVVGVLVLAYVAVVEISNRLPIGQPAHLAMIASDLFNAESKDAIPLEEIIDGGSTTASIPSIDKPQFESEKSADNYLSDDGLGLDVVVDGTHRFYPYQILVWHEIVNDTFGDQKLAVTYDPLCGAGMVYDRATYDFGTSGLLYNNNFLMIDRDGKSLWSQATGKAVVGDAVGSILATYPSTVMKWVDWKKANPDGSVLSRKTGVIRDYTSNPYGNYANTSDIEFPLSKMDGSRPVKEVVHGADGSAMYWFCWVTFRPGEQPIPLP